MTVKGDRYNWNGLNIEVLRVAKTGSWADIKVDAGSSQWTKRQPLPLPDSFKKVEN